MLLPLSVAHIGLEGIISVGVTMTHKGNDAILGLLVIQDIQLFSYLGNILFGIVQQRHTQENRLVLRQLCQIIVIKVSAGNVAVVHEFLHACNDSSELFARDNLQ